MSLRYGWGRRANGLRELQAAQKGHKPLCLLHESDPEKNGTPLSELKAACPAKLQSFVFEGREVLPWLRIRDFQVVTLVAVAEQVLLQSPSYAGRSTLSLKLPGDLRESSLTLPERVLLFVSESNPGAEEVASELQRCTEAMANRNSLASWRRSSSNSRQRASTEGASSEYEQSEQSRLRSGHGSSTLQWTKTELASSTHFLLVLNDRTFIEDDGALAAEVRQAMDAKLPFLLVHENDLDAGGLPFDAVIKATPADLVSAQLYGPLAVAWYPGEHREVCALLLRYTHLQLMHMLVTTLCATVVAVISFSPMAGAGV